MPNKRVDLNYLRIRTQRMEIHPHGWDESAVITDEHGVASFDWLPITAVHRVIFAIRADATHPHASLSAAPGTAEAELKVQALEGSDK
jgi:hypothetical protein